MRFKLKLTEPIYRYFLQNTLETTQHPIPLREKRAKAYDYNISMMKSLVNITPPPPQYSKEYKIVSFLRNFYSIVKRRIVQKLAATENKR